MPSPNAQGVSSEVAEVVQSTMTQDEDRKDWDETSCEQWANHSKHHKCDHTCADLIHALMRD